MPQPRNEQTWYIHTNGIPLSNKRNNLLIHTVTWMNLKCNMLSERKAFWSYSHDILERENYLGRKQISCYQGLECREKDQLLRWKRNFGGWWNCSISWLWWKLHDCICWSKFAELCTKKGWLILYVNYTLI